MSIAVNVRGPIANIVLSGGIDYSTQEKFREATDRAVSARNVREIHIDFANVAFMDSSGIRALLVLQKQAEEKGISLVVLNCSKAILEVFEIGGFDQMFTIR
jgi:anti-anti-sigma factor